MSLTADVFLNVRTLENAVRRISKKSRWKKFFLVICKTLGLFLNTSTADDKYSFLNRNNLMQHLQVQLSQKRKNFTTFSFAFSKLIFNFEYFQNHDDPNSRCIFELPGSEKRI